MLLDLLMSAAVLTGADINAGLIAIGAGIAVFTGVGPAMAQGRIAASALEGMSRNPEATNQLRATMILGIALAETTGIYGLLIAILLIFFG
jgi:F-type H+-transporting ATPase subunit c